jgi:hypothetical protein
MKVFNDDMYGDTLNRGLLTGAGAGGEVTSDFVP